MQRVDVNSTSDRKKLIWAIGLGLVAIIFLWWTFIGFGSSSPTPRVATQPGPPTRQVRPAQSQQATAQEIQNDPVDAIQPIIWTSTQPGSSEARRNIFAFYVPPKAPVVAEAVVTPTPTPTPPVLLASLSPANVYARTSDFNLELSGDKFTPALRVVIDGRELQTHYSGPQQISASVPASVIATAGARQVVLRSPDGVAYSNPVTLNVSQPPIPNYLYVGIIGTRRYSDTAIVQDRSNREILNVQRGDVLGGRFRVTSISEKELVLTDTTLKIRHPLPFTVEGERNFNPLQRPTPRVDAEDDEPL